MNTYEMIFNQRGYKYDQAMRAFPHARAQEFRELVNQFHYPPGTVVTDIPCGGEYLKHYLPADCHYVGFDPCHDNFKQNQSKVTDFLPLPMDDQSTDITLSLAGLHHLENKTKLFEEFKRITKSNGYLGIADVYQDSSTAIFLDDFVGKYNKTGHQGIYLSDKTLVELNQAGWKIVSAKHTKLIWVFDNKWEMGAFCRCLFDLTCTIEKLMDGIDQYLKVETLARNKIGLHWELFMIVAC